MVLAPSQVGVAPSQIVRFLNPLALQVGLVGEPDYISDGSGTISVV